MSYRSRQIIVQRPNLAHSSVDIALVLGMSFNEAFEVLISISCIKFYWHIGTAPPNHVHIIYRCFLKQRQSIWAEI